MDIKALLSTTPALVKAIRNARSGRPMAMSFDIADFCTLECPYCYWLESTQHKQLPVESIVALVRELADRGIVHATWVGGEPTLRPDVLDAVTAEMPINWIVTNGMKVKKSMAGPEYKNWDVEDLPANCWPILSLDGVGNQHDVSRGHAGLYDQLVSRFFNTPRSKRVMTTTTLHVGNANQPQHLLKEWRHSGIKGMTFEFATPIGRKVDPSLDLVGEGRTRVIEELLQLKKTYGSFMLNSLRGLEMQRPENLSRWIGPRNCPTAKLSISLDSLGRVKAPCILGSNPANPKGSRPNCGSCGCHVPTVLDGIVNLDVETIRTALWFLL